MTLLVQKKVDDNDDNDENENETNLKLKKLVGQLRFEKEIQQFGYLLMVVGIPEIIQPLTWICGLINGGGDSGVRRDDGDSDPITITTGLPFSTLIGYCCCVVIGILAVLVGYAAAFHTTAGHKYITMAVSIFVQTAYILTVSTCMSVTRVASEGKNFDIPLGSLSSNDDLPEPNVQLLATMGVVAIISYWFGMLGSISLLLGSLQKFQEFKPEERPKEYYSGRLLFYSCILGLGGISQFVIGIHLEVIYDCNGGPLPNNSFIKCAMLLIRYPSLAIIVGVIQICNSIYGIVRYYYGTRTGSSGLFVTSIWFGWVVQLIFQIMIQPSILPGTTAARAPPTLTAFAFGMNFMPAFLDSKSNSMPIDINREYYGLKDEEEDEQPLRLLLDDDDDNNDNENDDDNKKNYTDASSSPKVILSNKV